MFKKLYLYSISENRKTRIIFWGILVFINAFFGFGLGIDVDSLKVGMVLGILTWFIIYAFIVDYFYQKSDDFFRKSMFTAYFLKTLSVFIGISFVIDMGIGLTSIHHSESFLKFFGINIPRIEDSVHGDFSAYPILYPYITTLIHGGILSFYTFFLGILILFINIIREGIFQTSEKVRKKIF